MGGSLNKQLIAEKELCTGRKMMLRTINSFKDDEAMVIRLYFKEGLVVNERKFSIGIEIRNSEVGTYSLQIRVIVSSSEYGNFILTSTSIIRLKHSGSGKIM